MLDKTIDVKPIESFKLAYIKYSIYQQYNYTENIENIDFFK